MSFLNPFYLAALAAVAIPLIVHMLSRRRVPVYYFSSLRFLRTSDRRSMRRVNLRRILLMILRMTGIALLALAFARPVVRGGLASLFPAGGTSACCVLLDRSYSMGVETDEGTLFETARGRVREILDRFTPDDEVTLILFDSGRERVYRGGGDARAIGLFLDEAEVSYGTTDLHGAVMDGLEALEGSGRERRELYVVSDFQRSSLASGGGTGPRRGTDRDGGGEENAPRREGGGLPVRAYLVKVDGEATRNAAVTRVAAPGVTLHAGEIATVQAVFEGWGGESRFPVELHLDGKRILEKEIETGPSRPALVEFSFPVEGSGWSRGEVRKRSDGLGADDRRYFAIEVVERTRVLLVADGRSLYLEQALSPEGADTDIELETKGYGEFTSDDLDGAEVLVLGPGRGLRRREAPLIERFASNGGRVLLLLLPELDEAAAALSSFPLSIDRMGPGEGFLTIRAPDAVPYFLKPLGPETTEGVTRLRFERAALVSGVPRGEALLLFSNGSPFAWEEGRGSGSILFLAIDPVPAAGDLVLSPYFLPMVQQAVLTTRRTPSRAGALIGERVRWRGAADGAVCLMPAGGMGEEGRPERPDFLAMERDIRETGAGGLLLPPAKTPGFITLTSGDDTVALFAVNPDCELESDLTRAAGSEAAESLGLEHFVVIGREASISRAVGEAREGREITAQIAAAAILVFVIESVVAQRRYEGGGDVG